MSNAARLIATRLLVEAEPGPESNPEPLTPTPPEDPGFSAKDFIISQSMIHGGLAEPSYFQRLSDQLGRRAKVKLEGSTYLLRQPDGSITIRFHTTDIIKAERNGMVTISTYGAPNPKQVNVRKRWGMELPGYGPQARSWRTPITRDKIVAWLPCGWTIYTHGKSSLPSATAMVGGKRGDQNWWWANQHSRSGYWNGTGSRVPFSDLDQIDTNTGDLKSHLPPVPYKGRGSNPERTSGFGYNDKFYEAKGIAPSWTETGGVFGDFTAWPEVDWYAECPQCGQVHGDYKTMREAHVKRLCPRCEVESVNRVKDAVAHVDDPGMTPKKVLRMVGESDESLDQPPDEPPDEPFDVRDHILNYQSTDWIFRAKKKLEEESGVELRFVDETVPELDIEDPNAVEKFELEAEPPNNERYWVFKNSDIAEAHALEMVTDQLEIEPEMFSQEWLINYIDTDKLKEYLMPEDSYLEHEDVSRQIEKLIEDGLLQEDDFYTPAGKFRKITPKLQNLIDAALEEFKDRQNEDFDPLDYLKDIYGEQEWIKEAFKIVPLYGDSLANAAQTAIDADGWAHFVATYDVQVIELEADAVAARTN